MSVCELQIEYDDVVPVLPAKSMTHNKSFLDRLQRVEKHLRKNKLKLTLTQRLGNAQDEDDVRHRAPTLSLKLGHQMNESFASLILWT